MIELRCRTRISEDELKAKVGKVLTADDYNVLLTRKAKVLKPNGQPLCVYLPGALPPDLMEASYATLHHIRRYTTDNRAKASGMKATQRPGSSRSRTPYQTRSATLGGFDPSGQREYCRLTAFTAKEGERYEGLFPLFQAIGAEFERYVPDRFAVQMGHAARTHPDWVVPGTPFTTITVNNTYSTGVHTDRGDLDEGFSTLAVLRRGDYGGGELVFPEYRVAVDMHDGDVILMDAHEWHGNVKLEPRSEDAERISVVCYFRTQMTTCGSLADEQKRAEAWSQARNDPSRRDVRPRRPVDA